jgi:FecR protein
MAHFGSTEPHVASGPRRRVGPAARLLAAAVAGLVTATAGAAPTRPATRATTATTTSPASAPAAGQRLEATVTGVEGLVQVRAAADQQWQICKVGMVLDEGAEFRTAPRSAVRFTIPPGQTVTLDRSGACKLLRAVMEAGRVTTDVGLEHGRIRYDLEAPGVEARSTIRSPNSTLAVRGTKVSLYDQRPFPPEAVSLTGRAEFSTFKRQLAFGGPRAGKAKVSQDRAAAEQSLVAAVLDPSIPLARSAEEQQLVATLLSRGSTIILGDDSKAIPIVRGGTVPRTDAELQSFLVGELNFVLRWEGDANLDLVVGNQAGRGGELLLPASGVNTSRSGGRIPFDHQGGSDGGIELANWGSKFPSTIYPVGVNYSSGTPARYTLDVFLNGSRQNILENGVTPVTTLSGTVSRGNPTDLALVPVNTQTPVPPQPPGPGGGGLPPPVGTNPPPVGTTARSRANVRQASAAPRAAAPASKRLSSAPPAPHAQRPPAQRLSAHRLPARGK